MRTYFPVSGLFNCQLPFSFDKVVCKGVVLFFLNIRTVARPRGLLLSDTVPDSFILVCENRYTGSMQRTAGKKAVSKIFRMDFGFAGGFSKLEYKVNELFRRWRTFVMKGCY